MEQIIKIYCCFKINVKRTRVILYKDYYSLFFPASLFFYFALSFNQTNVYDEFNESKPFLFDTSYEKPGWDQ